MAKNLWTEEEINILKDMINKSIGYKEISKVINRTEYAISTKVNHLKLETLYTNNANYKAIYQDYDWCYEMFMNRGMNHEEMAEEAHCSERVIEKWCCEKHKITQKLRQQNKQLNQIQTDLIIGSLIGDGHIDKRETQPVFIVSHAENQKDYLYWKYNILKDLCNSPPSYLSEGNVYFNNKAYNRQASYRICTRIHNCLIPLRSMDKIDIINKLNEFSLSVFILDDGYRSDYAWEICVASFNDSEKEYFMKILKNRFGILSNKRSDDRYIGFKGDSFKLLDKIILKNIPNDLDIIQYKIINKKKVS